MKTYLKQYKAKLLAEKYSDKLIITLSHSYSKIGLGGHLFKGNDVDLILTVADALTDDAFKGFVYLITPHGPSILDGRSKKKTALL